MRLGDLLMMQSNNATRSAVAKVDGVRQALYGRTPYMFLMGKATWPGYSVDTFDGRGIEPVEGLPRAGIIRMLLDLEGGKKIDLRKLPPEWEQVAAEAERAGLVKVDGGSVSVTEFGRRYVNRFRVPSGISTLAQVGMMWAGANDAAYRGGAP